MVSQWSRVAILEIHRLQAIICDCVLNEISKRFANTKVFFLMPFFKVQNNYFQGDSGSPLVIGNELVGIVSWGIPCAVGFPDVHTRLAPYVDWIKMHIREGYCGAPKRQFFYAK